MTEPERNHPEGLGRDEQTQLGGLRRAMDSAGIDAEELWLHYFGIGGLVGEYEVDAYLESLLSLPPLQRDLLAHAANEIIDDLRPGRAPLTKTTKNLPPATLAHPWGTTPHSRQLPPRWKLLHQPHP
ncbi:hypothetical protein [Paenarthrobacter histidinolovorans]|uniref:hypothetical protein n=1 Tax=Paenarthrobacter histidinolovorans TaxID=43664 RepID=UPI0019C951A7|nr:hypothetical protein [Paenarthrobacter histidinolovorans]GGJ22807.1 hypothetical protein GCM10010052_19880 [Paenarthrobacter histidinolovorans]